MDDAEGHAQGAPTGRGGRRSELYDAIRGDGRQLAASLIQLLHAAAETSALNPTDFQCLVLLRLGDPLSPGEIATRLKLATGTVTSVVDRLERHGLVYRDRHPDDRRRIVVRPVDAPLTGGSVGGTGVLPGLGEPMVELHDRYSEAELETIAGWLHEVGGVIRAFADNAR
ncbi:MarR family winged helix-turn-helix transcriptional regulator [Nocardiopsis xinjiangensis]|uniref:MarR family winged helix-turn-helix transcriptional regulator n=1 Tax=Nocardiopsis xinjiangensis TaxID=124285 RepID=UPI00034C9A9F|nr:MarR family transcriptional regulator [Nocardiopsis xinjiangensis]